LEERRPQTQRTEDREDDVAAVTQTHTEKTRLDDLICLIAHTAKTRLDDLICFIADSAPR